MHTKKALSTLVLLVLTLPGTSAYGQAQPSSSAELPAPRPSIKSAAPVPERSVPAQSVAVLRELVDDALEHNPAIAAMARSFDAMQARVPQAKAWPQPMLEVGSMGNIVPFDVQNGDPSSGRIVTVTQEVMWPGKLSLMGKMAGAEAEAEWWAYEQMRREVVAEVKDSCSGRDDVFDELYRGHLKAIYASLGAAAPRCLDEHISPHTVVWTHSRPVAAVGPRDRLTIRTHCPGRLSWLVDGTAPESADLAPEGGVMAGKGRYSFVLGPFGAEASLLEFVFECQHERWTKTHACCQARVKRVRVGDVDSARESLRRAGARPAADVVDSMAPRFPSEREDGGVDDAQQLPRTSRATLPLPKGRSRHETVRDKLDDL